MADIPIRNCSESGMLSIPCANGYAKGKEIYASSPETYASGLGNLCLGSPDIRYDQSYKWLKRYRGENSAPSETQPCALALASRL